MNDSSLGRVLAVGRHDLRILIRDPMFVVIFTIMPLGFMAFTKGAFGAAMSIRYPGQAVNGAEQVVPGAAVLFSGFLVGNLGFAVFREHAWSTWERLRASHLETWELMLGKRRWRGGVGRIARRYPGGVQRGLRRHRRGPLRRRGVQALLGIGNRTVGWSLAGAMRPASNRSASPLRWIGVGDEEEWGTCPRCGRDARITWHRTYVSRGADRLRAGVRIRVRCIDPGCSGKAGPD